MYNPVHPGSQHFPAVDKFTASYEPNRPGISQFHSKLSAHQTAYQSWQHPHPNSEPFHNHPHNFNHLAQTLATEFSSSPWGQSSSSQPLTSQAPPYYQTAQLQQYPPHHQGYYPLHPTPRYADPESNHYPGRDTTTNSQTHPMMKLHPYDTSTQLTPHTQAAQHSYTTTSSKSTLSPQGSLQTPTESTPMENSYIVNLEPSKALLSDTMAVTSQLEAPGRVGTVSNRKQTAPPSTNKTNSCQHHLPKRGRRGSIRSSSSSKEERDDDEEEEDKYERRRRLNRLSAQRFRERGRALVADLESQVALLQMACMDVEERAAQLKEEKEAWVKEREHLLERVRQVELIKVATHE